jgi:hydrogenase-4 membrane subunit HyfE
MGRRSMIGVAFVCLLISLFLLVAQTSAKKYWVEFTLEYFTLIFFALFLSITGYKIIEAIQ